jgi:hypothetical protein
VSDLLPCPFCGAGATHIKEGGKVWSGMAYGAPCSVSVIHWCPDIDGQPSRRIERIGRDEESAIAAWNRRTTPAEPGPYDFDVKLGEQMYVDSSMQYRNGTVNLTIKRKAREAIAAIESQRGEGS